MGKVGFIEFTDLLPKYLKRLKEKITIYNK